MGLFSFKADKAAKPARDLYLGLMKSCLTNMIYGDANVLHGGRIPYDPALRAVGQDWPARAHTMVGLKRLDNLQFCVEDVLERGVPGDLMETGVWRGGTVILMRAILAAHGVAERRVWAADSFEGLPAPDAARYPRDVQENFRAYGLLDDQVRFLKGWFRDTLPGARSSGWRSCGSMATYTTATSRRAATR